MKTHHDPPCDLANQCPPTTLANSSTTPAALGTATLIWPGLLLNMYSPIKIAIGMVMPIVNTPQGLFDSALTTTIPSPAKVTSRINNTANMVTSPVNVLTSVRATSASDRPLCRTDATITIKSCTHPATTAPIKIQTKPGAKPNCAANVGPTRGPAPAMAAK